MTKICIDCKHWYANDCAAPLPMWLQRRPLCPCGTQLEDVNWVTALEDASVCECYEAKEGAGDDAA